MEPWGTPALTFFHVENCPLRITRCFLSFKKSRKRFSKFPDMPFWVSLKMIPSCHTLSNAFAISRNILLTSRPLSKELYTSCVIDNSWLIQESPGLKPDWLDETTTDNNCVLTTRQQLTTTVFYRFQESSTAIKAGIFHKTLNCLTFLIKPK